MTEPKLRSATETKQDYGTPIEFIQAIERRFGSLDWDLAANAENRKAPQWIGEEEDSLSVQWAGRGKMWLNPPFKHIEPWAEKCAKDRLPSDRIFFLTPASVGTNWFWDHVFGNALVLPIHPRLTFDGAPINPKKGKPDVYPKDLMLSVFGLDPGFARWTWEMDNAPG